MCWYLFQEYILNQWNRVSGNQVFASVLRLWRHFVNTFGLNCAGAAIVRLKWVTNYLNDVKRGCLLTRLGGEWFSCLFLLLIYCYCFLSSWPSFQDLIDSVITLSSILSAIWEWPEIVQLLFSRHWLFQKHKLPNILLRIHILYAYNCFWNCCV